MRGELEKNELKSIYSDENIKYLENIFPIANREQFSILRNDGVNEERGSGKRKHVPIWEKSNLTLEEAAAYFGIGINKLRSMTDSEECGFVLWNGTRRLIKRRKLEAYLDGAYSI